ncbi:MAG TPA: gamma-glutamyl-gamma-aminobutyrate hydrolase family protein, partial [Anaerolineae bacterium]|nr:gamma-glutamyl-gamma-aminobutyrate hydrolase family protein [Anaerolineae bacterium]
MKTQPVIGVTASIDQRAAAYGETYSLTRKYAEGVVQAGGIPIIVPHNLDEEALHALLDRLDGVLLSGGGDIDPAWFGEEAHPATGEIEPDRDRVELTLARWLVEQEKPFLAICRGIQVLNVAWGGSLIQDIPAQVPGAVPHSFDRKTTPRHYLAHSVKIDPASHLARVMQLDTAQTNSWHHQAIKQVADRLRVTAVAPDGIIEAVEVPGQRCALGVQWHPEWLFEERV